MLYFIIYNPGQKSLGLGFPLITVHHFRNFLALAPPYTKVKLGKNV